MTNKKQRLGKKQSSKAVKKTLRSRAKQQACRLRKGLTSKVTKELPPKAIRVFVAGGSRPGYNPDYMAEAFHLGQVIGKRNYQLTFGWSSRGIMGAVAQGVLETWKHKNQDLLNFFKPLQGITTEHYQALYPDDALVKGLADVIVAHNLEDRKKALLSAEFIVFAPGGLGTLDELVYDCTAMQDGWLEVKPFILFNVNGFFHHILEYLKDIQLKGFSDRVPFIVVDDVFELEVAFSMISYYRPKILNKTRAAQIVDKIIHELPYAIEQVKKDRTISVSQLLKNRNLVTKNGSAEEKQALEHAIETAYLTKEIQRMNDRLIATSRDTALVSHKLDELKQKMEKTRRTDGFY